MKINIISAEQSKIDITCRADLVPKFIHSDLLKIHFTINSCIDCNGSFSATSVAKFDSVEGFVMDHLSNK